MNGNVALKDSRPVIKWVICEGAQTGPGNSITLLPSHPWPTLAMGPLGLNTIRAPSPVYVHPDRDAKWAALRILFWRR